MGPATEKILRLTWSDSARQAAAASRKGKGAKATDSKKSGKKLPPLRDHDTDGSGRTQDQIDRIAAQYLDRANKSAGLKSSKPAAKSSSKSKSRGAMHPSGQRY